MNFELFITLVTTVLVAVIGWFIVHRLSANREREAKKREMRVQYLLDAWRSLANATNRKDNSRSNELESAIEDIQLLGTDKQIKLAIRFAEEFARNNKADLDELLNDLRSDLRKELKLEIAANRIKHLRIASDSDKKDS